MVSSQVATVTQPSTGRADSSVSQKNVSDALTEEGRFELEQCRKIVQLRDEILAGKHPRIKLPPHLAAKAAASAQKPSPPTLLPASQVYRNLDQPSRQANTQAVGANAAAPVSAPAGASASKSAPKAFATGRTQIDPVLLEKSDHLIRAELGLRRQKLERALREEADNKKVGAQVELPEELDVSDILAKALALVQATTVPPTGAVDPANAAAEEDTSFDENDYYSSNHETLDSHDSPVRVEQASGVRRGDAQSGITHVVSMNESGSPGSRPVQAPNGMRAGHQQYVQPELQPRSVPAYHVTPSSRPSRLPSAGASDNRQHDKTVQSGPDPRKPTRPHTLQTTLSWGEAPRSDTSARMEVDREVLDNGPGQQLAREAEYAATHQRGPPGLTSTQNVAPIPSPATHASSPMAGARLPPHPPVVASTDLNAPRGAPAQVAALRNEHQGPSSPESSSPHGKGSAQRKCKKKNKRKADRFAQDAAPAPHIKTEPRSQSPLSAPAIIRPAKRQKHVQRPDADTTYAQPQPQGPARPDIYQLAGPQPVERAPGPVTYERYAAGAPDASPVYGGQGYERVYHDDAQSGMEPSHRGHYDPQAYPPRGYPVQYAGDEYGPTRSVSYREPARYYLDDYARHPAEPTMVGSQRPPLTRVMVDTFGREYYEPSHTQPTRQSVAPIVRPGPGPADADVIYEGTAPVRRSVAPQMLPRDSEVIYERTGPARATSRLPPGPESYEEGGVIYRRVSPPPFPVPRRVVTQPEYGAPEHMGYARAYSVRPMGPPPDDYAPGPERRPVDGVLRQYPGRSASARPLEPVRYDMSADGGGHMQAAMPDEAGLDYGMSRPLSRVGTMGPPAVREYAPRAGEPVGMQRPYSTRPVERYYGEPQPMGEEAGYVERPPQHGVVYAEPRRDVYR